MARQWLHALGIRGPADKGRPRHRIERYFDCTWLGPWGEEKSRVSSLSQHGCYVDSRFTAAAEGSQIADITIALPTGALTLQGTVINVTPGIGFAVRFTGLDDDTRARLIAVVGG